MFGFRCVKDDVGEEEYPGVIVAIERQFAGVGCVETAEETETAGGGNDVDVCVFFISSAFVF